MGAGKSRNGREKNSGAEKSEREFIKSFNISDFLLKAIVYSAAPVLSKVVSDLRKIV